MSIAKRISLSCAALGIFSAIEASNLIYETYLESWDSQWQSVVQNLPPASGQPSSNSYAGVTLNVGFACYNFAGSPPNGFQFPSPSDLATVVSFVQSHGGKARVSFGGASYAPPCAPYYFISQTPGWPGNAASLATGVISVVTNNNLDGVDFDIEDPQPGYTTPQGFASDLITFLKDVRAGLPAGKTLTITIPAQGWNTYWYYLATQAAAVPGLVDYINFMEYDIWVNSSITYPEQILADIATYTSSPTTAPPPNYSPGWGIPASLVQLGLMPGCDDTMQYLSVSDAVILTDAAIEKGLHGVMTWDLDRDAGTSQTPACSTFPSGYQYTINIRGALGTTSTVAEDESTQYPRRTRLFQGLLYERQESPNHGAP